jgi:hypothetical protein
MSCVESITDRLSPDVSVIGKAVLISCSETTLLPKYARVTSPFVVINV